ncbi:hypothetical protein [Pseudoalteromonas arabiensis]|uniref:hypothetical protein n=1 Tax=Pseudoalteromonas arabiensis TaxID=874454 RepID=UPI00078346F7|nr:hypothetical protein [Pseudoalteromonas arabiensis]
MIRTMIFLSLCCINFTVHGQSKVKCNTASERLPIYSEQISSNSIEASLNVWKLTKDNLKKREISSTTPVEKIYNTFLNAYQKENLEEHLFYNTKIIQDITNPFSHNRIIQAKFPNSHDFDLFFIEVKNDNNEFFMKTIIVPRIEQNSVQEAVAFINDLSTKTVNKCQNNE